MNNYRSCKEKITLSPRIMKIREGVLSRMKSWNEREMTYTGPEGDGKLPFLDAFEANPTEPYVICLAKGIVNSWLYSEPILYPGDILAGHQRPMRPLREHFSWGIQYDPTLLDQPLYQENKGRVQEKIETLSSRLFPLNIDHISGATKCLFGEENFTTVTRLFSAGGYQGHTVPDYFKLLEMGVEGTLEEIHKYEVNTVDKTKVDLYRAMRILLQGFQQYALGFAKKAEQMAAAMPEEKERFLSLAENCRFVAYHKPETYYQAAQLMWFYSIWDWSDCIGRFDMYMYPFYEKAVREGDVYTAEEITAALFLKFSENGVHNIPLGGVDPDSGEDATNDLSFLMLQIARAFYTVHPRLACRIDAHSPKEFMALAVQMWSEGMSDPTLVSDELVIPGLVSYGVSLKDARSYTTLGCQEIEIPGKSNVGCEDGSLNLAKIFEYTINDGKDRFDGHQVGLQTGYITDYDSVEDLWDAFVKQVEFITPRFLELCNRGQEVRAANVSKLWKSIYTGDCVSRGMHMDEGGAVYNYGVIETAGASAVADSFAAIDKLVFKEKKVSREELEAALANDFVGHEATKHLLLQAPKYGNDDPLADGYMVRILDFFWNYIGQFRSVRGGIFTGACSLLSSGIGYGMGTWAMPDGRNKGEELGNTIGPRTGADKNGLTAMLNSVMKLPLQKGIGGTTVNVLIPRPMMSTQKGKDSIAAVMTAFMMNGGQFAQVTTAALEDMKDAKIHPEKHQNLIVRVGGYSAPYIELGEEIQDEVIKRYGYES